MADKISARLVVAKRVPHVVTLINEVSGVVALVRYGADELPRCQLKGHDDGKEVVTRQLVAAAPGQLAHTGQVHSLAQRFEVILFYEHDLRRVGPGLYYPGVVLLYPLLKAFVLDRLFLAHLRPRGLHRVRMRNGQPSTRAISASNATKKPPR